MNACLIPLARFRCLLVLCAALSTVSAFGEASAAAAAPFEPSDFATRVFEAWRDGRPMPQLKVADPGASLADGYAIQKLVAEKMLAGAAPGGYKAAIVGKGGQDAMGITGPLVAPLPAGGILLASDKVVVSLAKDPSRHIETEIGYKLGEDIERPLEKLEDLRKKVRAVAPMIELPGGPVENAQPPAAADLLAWNINAKEIIVGPETDTTMFDLDGVAVSLVRDGVQLNHGKGSDAAGGQWETLLKTVNAALRLGYPVRKGMVIINGALGKIVKAEPGTYQADYGSFGLIEFRVE